MSDTDTESALAALELRAEEAERELASLAQRVAAGGAADPDVEKAQSDEVKKLRSENQKAEYRINHLIKYINVLEAKTQGDAREKEIAKLNYRIAHLLKYIEELEGQKASAK